MTPSAYSIDGRTFVFEADVASAIPVGAYVRLSIAEGDAFLGQVLALEVDPSSGATDGSGSRALIGRGNLMSQLDGDDSRPLEELTVFDNADVGLADPAMIACHLRSGLGSSAGIELGTMQQLPEVPAVLRASGFGRHTFLCGQSGSGKTYTLGVILERLMVDTDIRVVVLDPNSDFVTIGSLRTGDTVDDEQLIARYADVVPRIHVAGGEGADHRLRALYGRLSLRQQTMVLGLDPLADAEEYNAFVRLVSNLPGTDYSLEDVMDSIRASFDDDARRLGLRIANLGVMEQSIWAGSTQPIMGSLPDDWRMLVADLGSLGSPTEVSIASAAVLGFLWQARTSRQPIIVVIDEAHNVCPQSPSDANQALATEHVVRIAGEGRKYGLNLLLSTQRPDKVHQNVLSQCDNLVLMKMNSRGDIGQLSQLFSYAPPTLIEQASSFGLGEGLAAGKIAPDPLLFACRRRLTIEGGRDVPATWAEAR